MTRQITTEVSQLGPIMRDMTGRSLGYKVTSTDKAVSKGLVAKLIKYAESELEASGFLAAVQGWSVTVGADMTEFSSKVADRIYSVTFTNDKGGSIAIEGILLSNGKPSLDHGFSIDRG